MQRTSLPSTDTLKPKLIVSRICRVSRNHFSRGHRPQSRRMCPIVLAHGTPPHGTSATTTTEEAKTFMDELRSYAMRLHTKEQAPREGKAEAPKEQKPWVPTKEGYLNFLVQSREVYRAFETVMASKASPAFVKFCNTGLERGAALDRDIAYMKEQWGLTAAEPTADGPGMSYANVLRKLAADNVPAFMCHYYNFYFAHTAGGRMIGTQVSKAALDGWMGDFYRWEGDVRSHLNAVRESLNEVANGWTEEEKQMCLEETPRTFKYSGELLRCIAGGSTGH